MRWERGSWLTRSPMLSPETCARLGTSSLLPAPSFLVILQRLDQLDSKVALSLLRNRDVLLCLVSNGLVAKLLVILRTVPLCALICSITLCTLNKTANLSSISDPSMALAILERGRINNVVFHNLVHADRLAN